MKRNGSKSSRSRTKTAKPDIDRIFRDGRLIDKALRKAVREALLAHKRAGNPICIWRDGKVVWIPPEKIRV